MEHYVLTGPYSLFDESMKRLLKEYSSFYSQNEKGWILKKIFYKSLIEKIKSNFPSIFLSEIPDIAIRSLEPSPDVIYFKIEKESMALQYDQKDRQKKVDSLPPKFYQSLYKFQEEGIEFAIRNNCRVLIADEMGVGKTIQAISLAYLFKEEWPCLVICPSSLRLNWRDEIKKWIARDIKNFEIQIVQTSNVAIKNDSKIVIISYDLCSKMIENLERKNFGFIIADEAHYLKNSLAKRTEALCPLLQKTRRVLLLSGTPAFAKPKELFTLVQILRPDIFRFFKDFGNRYCDPKPSKWSKGIDFDGASNSRELHYILTTNLMIRRLKKDVLSELPSKRRQKVEVSVDSKLSQEILKLLNKTLGVDEHLENMMSVNSLVTNMFSNESENHPKKSEINEVLNRCYLLTGLAKLKGVKQYISDILQNDCKFLIFGHHLEILDGVEEEINSLKLKYIRIDGTTPMNKRHDFVNLFQTDAQIKVAILSISATGVGLTLTAASTIIFAEMHWTPAMMLQAEDRAHRIGQVSCVNCHYLYGDGTLDDRLYYKLEKKLGVVSEVLDGFKKDLEVQDKLEIGTLGDVSKKEKMESGQKARRNNLFDEEASLSKRKGAGGEKITDYFLILDKKREEERKIRDANNKRENIKNSNEIDKGQNSEEEHAKNMEIAKKLKYEESKEDIENVDNSFFNNAEEIEELIEKHQSSKKKENLFLVDEDQDPPQKNKIENRVLESSEKFEISKKENKKRETLKHDSIIVTKNDTSTLKSQINKKSQHLSFLQNIIEKRTDLDNRRSEKIKLFLESEQNEKNEKNQNRNNDNNIKIASILEKNEKEPNFEKHINNDYNQEIKKKISKLPTLESIREAMNKNKMKEDKKEIEIFFDDSDIDEIECIIENYKKSTHKKDNEDGKTENEFNPKRKSSEVYQQDNLKKIKLN